MVKTRPKEGDRVRVTHPFDDETKWDTTVIQVLPASSQFVFERDSGGLGFCHFNSELWEYL